MNGQLVAEKIMWLNKEICLGEQWKNTFKS